MCVQGREAGGDNGEEEEEEEEEYDTRSIRSFKRSVEHRRAAESTCKQDGRDAPERVAGVCARA